ncbi:MAG: spermidine synthase [Sciscionella sp.]
MGPREVVEGPVRFGIAELVPDPARTAGWAVSVDGVLQSYVDLADPTYLKMPFTVWIAQVLDRHWPRGASVSAVHVGGGGFTLPRYLAASRPGSEQTVFELDGQLVDLVPEHLELDGVPGLRVRTRDGQAGIAELPDADVDLVVLDVVRGGDVVTDLAAVEFLLEIARVLRTGGLYTANIWDAADLSFARRAAAAAVEVFQNVLTFAEAGVLEKLRPGNVVIAASTSELPSTELHEWAASAEDHVFCLTPTQLTKVYGKAAPLTKADPLARPVPAVSRWRPGYRFT